MSELMDYVAKNSKTISLRDEESIEVKYQGYEIGKNRFDTEKDTINYKLETPFGVKVFSSGALSLARTFDNIEQGTIIRLTRDGEGTKTRYKVEIQDSEGNFSNVVKESE